MTSNEAILAYAMHRIPDDTMVSAELGRITRFNRRLQATLAYKPLWLGGRGGQLAGKKAQGMFLDANDACMVVTGQKFLFAKMTEYFDKDSMPYGLCYNFFLKGLKEHYTIVSAFNGFVLVTLPKHDYARALTAHNKCNHAEALMCIDRAIISLADLAQAISPEIERNYGKFAKLRNLYIDQWDNPEGKLACERAMQVGIKCYSMLNGG